ncbi:MAG TPA: DUF3187 family protein [Gammaproteobacteria bacterium]
MNGLVPKKPRRSAAFVLAAVAFAAGAVRADEGQPFRTRNLSPLVSIFGIPAWSNAPSEGTRVGLSAELANHYRFSQRGGEGLILDGETWRTALVIEHAFGENAFAAVEIPYYRQSGGELDDLIDSWHAAFNLPDGGRNRRAEDQITFVLDAGAGPFYGLGRRGGAIGDVIVSAGRRFGSAARGRSGQLRASLKVPTGDELWLAGSGSADFALTWLATRRGEAWGRPGAYYWGVGGLLLGSPDIIEYDARRAGLVGLLGGGIRPWRRWGVKAQLELHSALYESRLREIGDPGVQATIGGWRDLRDRGVVEFAINEDVAVSTSPDLVIHLNFQWEF